MSLLDSNLTNAPQRSGAGIDWSQIQTILLDMDGTLLDRHFDDVFFLQTIPEAYAALHHLDLDVSRQRVLIAYKQVEGTLNWYDLDYWSRQLNLDVPALQQQVAHLIQTHPHVTNFLQQLQKQGHPVHLVTNAHPQSLALKLSRTPIGLYLTGIVTSHDFGYPKEYTQFWDLLQKKLGFDPARTLFVDDSEAILERAAAFGIGHLVHMAQPSSAIPPAFSRRFFSIVGFHQIHGHE
ncbi:MAG: GMP/IMP nucleotidase [Magnetococcus sp. DMHC-1]|nr:GMP/IMP nucleotidase [Magnetococcales bacterium]